MNTKNTKNLNIVLTGFMGTGKTTVGKRVARRLHMNFIDTDVVIEQSENQKISEIFSIKGEAAFREIESRIVKDISMESNAVIATGGGVVLKKENIDNLRRNGIIIYFESNVNAIMKNTARDSNRPLLKVADLESHITKMLEYRRDYYSNHDYKIDVSTLSINDIADKVISLYNYHIKSIQNSGVRNTTYDE